MKTYGLIGFPLEHSFSQNYFTEKFEKIQLYESRYLNFPMESVSGLKDLIAANPDLRGLNITIPHKVNVIPLLDSLDETAQAVGAVNTIKVNADGSLKGYNTDVWGFARSLLNVIKPRHKQALILGTGGASLAVRYFLPKIGIAYQTVSRTPEAGEIPYEQLNDGVMQKHTLIINCTPLGTFPDTASCPDIPYESLTEQHLLYDLVYNPPLTEFLKRGKAKGASIKNGEEMLKQQAEESWRIWNSKE
jgi:shikimate dehydrogenase